MATLPTTVQPGDIISSELMNAILAELARLGGNATQTGSQVVPNVFGAFLGDARAAILAPSRQLAMGFTFDVAGAAIDPIASANVNRIVLNQQPSANSLVAPGTPVNLVVSGLATSTSPTPSPPVISGTESLTGTPGAGFAVDSQLVIVGSGFSATASQNIVSFDGVSATVSVDPTDPTRRLVVTVPTGIPNAPINPGDPQLDDVAVNVRIGTGASASTTISILPPVALQPSIISVNNASPFEGDNITITGSNLTVTAEVLIRDVAAAVVTRSPPSQITVTVPDFPDILPGPPVDASLVVSVPGVGEAAFSGVFRVRG